MNAVPMSDEERVPSVERPDALGSPKVSLLIVDFKKDGAGGPGPAPEARIDPEAVIRQAAEAGFKLRSRETFLKYQYLLIFEK